MLITLVKLVLLHSPQSAFLMAQATTYEIRIESIPIMGLFLLLLESMAKLPLTSVGAGAGPMPLIFISMTLTHSFFENKTKPQRINSFVNWLILIVSENSKMALFL